MICGLKFPSSRGGGGAISLMLNTAVTGLTNSDQYCIETSPQSCDILITPFLLILKRRHQMRDCYKCGGKPEKAMLRVGANQFTTASRKTTSRCLKFSGEITEWFKHLQTSDAKHTLRCARWLSGSLLRAIIRQEDGLRC